jgi:hypothetical protein
MESEGVTNEPRPIVSIFLPVHHTQNLHLICCCMADAVEPSKSIRNNLQAHENTDLHCGQKVFQIAPSSNVDVDCYVIIIKVLHVQSTVTYEGFEWLIVTGSGFDDCIYWHFYYNYKQLYQLTNQWLSKTRSIPYWTTSSFSSAVTDLFLIYESITSSASVVRWLALHSWMPNDWFSHEWTILNWTNYQAKWI